MFQASAARATAGPSVSRVKRYSTTHQARKNSSEVTWTDQGGIPPRARKTAAALTAIPHELYEAAALDGAGPVARFRYIVLPPLKPTLLAVACLVTIYSMRAFDMIFALTQGLFWAGVAAPLKVRTPVAALSSTVESVSVTFPVTSAKTPGVVP